MCLGNDDENFWIFVTAKKHGFTDVSGYYIILSER